MFTIVCFIKHRFPYSWIAWNFRGGKKKCRCLPYHSLFLLTPNSESFQLDKKLKNCEYVTSNPCSTSTSLLLGWPCEDNIIGDSKKMGKKKESVQKWSLCGKVEQGTSLMVFLKCQFRKVGSFGTNSMPLVKDADSTQFVSADFLILQFFLSNLLYIAY